MLEPFKMNYIIWESFHCWKEKQRGSLSWQKKGSCKVALLEKKRSKLISRVIRKSSEIDSLMYSSQNGIAVKEELQ